MVEGIPLNEADTQMSGGKGAGAVGGQETVDEPTATPEVAEISRQTAAEGQQSHEASVGGGEQTRDTQLTDQPRSPDAGIEDALHGSYVEERIYSIADPEARGLMISYRDALENLAIEVQRFRKENPPAGLNVGAIGENIDLVDKFRGDKYRREIYPLKAGLERYLKLGGVQSAKEAIERTSNEVLA